MKKTIGILGGMGPLATADLFKKIVLMTKAGSDNEHIRIYIDNNAQIPDRTGAILGGGADPVPEMSSALKHLEACGADCIIMPCNTAHYFLPRLQSQTSVPFLSMLEATAASCRALFPGKTAAVLATRGTLSAGLYQKVLDEAGVAYVIPGEAEQDALMRVIYQGVKADAPAEHYRADWESVLSAMVQLGADYLILGCTELPLAAAALGSALPTVDPTEELARAAIAFCGYETKDRNS